MYMADHGDLMGDFGAYFKCSFLRGSEHVPIIVRVPGGPSGERRPQLAGLQDVLPTLAALTDCPLGAGVHGLDLSQAIRGAGAPLRDVFYSQCLDPPHQLGMAFDGRWKYCYAQDGPTEELYYLAEDPDELVNLASRPDAEALLKPWRQRLIAEAQKVGDTALLDGGTLATAPLDREAIAKLPLGGFGWRWF
jgi:choline-sulfatase